MWILHPAALALVANGDIRTVTEAPPPWPGWRLRLISLEQALSVSLPQFPVHLVRRDPRPRLLPGVPLPGVSTPYGLPVYPEPPRLQLPGDARWHVTIRPAAGGPAVASRELAEGGEADIWDGLPRPVLGEFDIAVRGPLGRSLRTTIFVAEGATVPDLGPADRPLVTDLHVGAGTEPVIVTPADPRTPQAHTASPGSLGSAARLPGLRSVLPGSVTPRAAVPLRSAVPPGSTARASSARPRRPAGLHGPAGPMGAAVFVSSARPVASGAEISSGQLTIRGCAQADLGTEGLAVALYLDRAPWRAPAVVPVPADGVVKLPPEVRDAGPLRVLLRAEDPSAPVNWPDWPGRDAFACAAPGLPASGDLEEDALSRFLAGERDLPVRPRRVEHLWRLLHLAGDLIATGAPADLRERCSAALATQPSLALTGLLDSGLDTAACVTGLIRTGLAAARPVMMDDMQAAERLWDLVPAAAAVLCSRLLAGPDYPDEDPAAVVIEAALAQCGPALAAVLSGRDDPHTQAAAPSVVPQPLLDAATRADAASQLSADVFRTPALARATQDASTVVSSARRLLAASPYHRAASSDRDPERLRRPGSAVRHVRVAGPGGPHRRPRRRGLPLVRAHLARPLDRPRLAGARSRWHRPGPRRSPPGGRRASPVRAERWGIPGSFGVNVVRSARAGRCRAQGRARTEAPGRESERLAGRRRAHRHREPEVPERHAGLVHRPARRSPSRPAA